MFFLAYQAVWQGPKPNLAFCPLMLPHSVSAVLEAHVIKLLNLIN